MCIFLTAMIKHHWYHNYQFKHSQVDQVDSTKQLRFMKMSKRPGRLHSSPTWARDAPDQISSPPISSEPQSWNCHELPICVNMFPTASRNNNPYAVIFGISTESQLLLGRCQIYHQTPVRHPPLSSESQQKLAPVNHGPGQSAGEKMGQAMQECFEILASWCRNPSHIGPIYK